jgi:TolA-binding protein
MPIERRYNQGSIVYFDNEVGDDIFVLKGGRLDISYIEPQSNEKITRTLNQGEFFGLKSAIINHPRGEVAEAVTECLTIVFKVSEFEGFVAKNVELMKRLLKVLSNQLRNLGIKVNNYLGDNVIYPPNIGLFKIGEYYLNNKKYKQAIQVYERYINAYPETNLAKEAKYRIEISNEAIKTGFLKGFKPLDEIMKTEGGDLDAFAVTDIEEGVAESHSKLGLKEFMNRFYKAESFFNGGDFESAVKEFEALFQVDSKVVNSDLKNKAKFLYVQCLFNLKKYNECSQVISEFIKVLKDPTMIKHSLFILADIYMDLGNKDSAKQILQKIVVLAPIDQLSKQAKERLSKLA